MRNGTLFVFFSFFISLITLSQWEENTTPTYPELIEVYTKFSKEHDEIQLFNMGQSDYGLPIYVCVINGVGDSLSTFEKARNETTILINNGIHPGEPDGINACLIWMENWINKGKKAENLPVIAIIPAYNVGGAMTRSSSSRANQDGPDEYGFRGNTQNLDLNRDFIKMDSENMFTFARIFQGLSPDVFIDTHVSNGADYQYTLTYIASIKERMAPSLSKLVHTEMIPELSKTLSKQGFPMMSYVDLKGDVPEKGIKIFNDLPRYSMGYAALFNTISFTVETHMLKPFKERTQATLKFLESTIAWTCDHKLSIEEARESASKYDLELKSFPFNYALSDEKDSVLFKGFEHSYPLSTVTGLPRLKYHRDRPYEKFVPLYNDYAPQDSIKIPDYYIIGNQNKKVLERLKRNGVKVSTASNESISIRGIRIEKFVSGKTPYEGHFLHSKVAQEEFQRELPKTEVGYSYVSTHQPNRRFIISVLEPAMPDSYFAWNFFDSYVQQKEYFSPYVFEDYAEEMLRSDADLKQEFEKHKTSDSGFNESMWQQLYFLYQRSKFYEPSHNVLPVYKGYRK